MLAVTAILKAKSGKGADLVALMHKITTEVRKEPGNHCYLTHQAQGDPETILMYEQYADAAALKAHGEHLKQLSGGLKELLAAPLDIKVYELKTGPVA